MAGRLSRGGGSIVANIAYANHMIVIDLGNRRPRGNTMTGFANRTTRNMIRAFGGGGRSVMATKAPADDPRMVKLRRNPTGRRVT